MTKDVAMALRAVMIGWVKCKCHIDVKNPYLSPPNLIYRLMTGDMGGGTACGSVEPAGLAYGEHNALYHRIDCIVKQMPKVCQNVIWCEFGVEGSQESKHHYTDLSLRSYQRKLNLSLNQIISDEFVLKHIKSP